MTTEFVRGTIIVPRHYRQDAKTYLLASICEGRRLKEICEEKDMPNLREVRGWLARDEELMDDYTAACRLRLSVEMLDILDIADGKEGVADTARDRLRVDARIKMASKLIPEIYGDKVELAASPFDIFRAQIAAAGAQPLPGVEANASLSLEEGETQNA